MDSSPEMLPEPDDLVPLRVPLPGGALHMLQPSEASELPDDQPVQWAPLVPYWAVLWRSGATLAREVASRPFAGLRVVELGCGLGVPSLAAARAGATVVATDGDADAIALVERNARENGLSLAAEQVSWETPDELIALGPFDIVLAADVLYEYESVALLLDLLPRLAGEVWLADPGRPVSASFLDRVESDWAVTTSVRDEVDIHELHRR